MFTRNFVETCVCLCLREQNCAINATTYVSCSEYNGKRKEKKEKKNQQQRRGKEIVDYFYPLVVRLEGMYVHM